MTTRTLTMLASAFAACSSAGNFAHAGEPQADKYFAIKVVDEQTGRGVPLVELKTTHNVRYYTDSAGVVAFYEPGLMGQDVYFFIRSHGYEYPKDGFGYAGKMLHTTEGGSAELKLKRINIAERLYRITGGGIYRDSVLLGRPAPLKQPVLNGLVLGQDSVLNAIYQGKLLWIWGDTTRVAYPLGNFNASGATSPLPGAGGLDPTVGVDLTYWVDDAGFSRGMAPVPGEGPTWLDALLTLRDADGREHLLAAYAKIRPGLSMETYERGFVEFNDDKQQFEKIATFDQNAPACPGGHPLCVGVDGVDYFYFARAFPLTRVVADREHYLDVASCEAFTCLKDGTQPNAGQIDRAADGTVRYAWRKNTPAVYPREQADLIKAGHLKPDEGLLQTQDPDTGKPVLIHGGSTYWNPYRHRWIMIATEAFGTSMLGEIWYAEADTPVGPWVYARKILTHDTYSFYNPRQHVEFDQDGGRSVFFEGTYTATFSGNPDPTPYYDYNQIMYRLDLAEPRLALPVPVYDLSDDSGPSRFATLQQLPPGRAAPRIAFFACDRSAPGTIAMLATPNGEQGFRLTIAASAAAPVATDPTPLFYALPPDKPPTAPTVVPLYEFANGDGRERVYSIDANWSRPGFERREQRVCYVWRNPLSPAIRFELHGVEPRR